MDIGMLSAAQMVRLVHADMDKFAVKAISQRRQHLVNQRVGALIVRQQNVVDIDIRSKAFPIGDGVQMRQRLNTGDDLQTQCAAVGGQLFHFLRGISAAQMTEIGIFRYFIGILGVQHEAVKAHHRQLYHQLFGGGDAYNRVAAAVRHQAQAVEFCCLRNRFFIL